MDYVIVWMAEGYQTMDILEDIMSEGMTATVEPTPEGQLTPPVGMVRVRLTGNTQSGRDYNESTHSYADDNIMERNDWND